jgi:hypothetical protein
VKRFLFKLIVIILLPLGYLFFHFIFQPQLNLRKIRNSLEKGIIFLEKNQLPSGQFATYRSRNSNMSNNFYVNSPYITTYILHSLNYVEQTSIVKRIKDKAIAYILSEREPNGLWRFYGKDPKNWLEEIPPDLDDTSCALSALKENGMEIDKNIIDYLLNFRNSEGIFYIWFEEPLKDKRVDCAINANILRLFSLQNKKLNEVCKYLNKVIQEEDFSCCQFCRSPYPFLYVLTRAYSEGASCLDISIPKLKIICLKNRN